MTTTEARSRAPGPMSIRACRCSVKIRERLRQTRTRFHAQRQHRPLRRAGRARPAEGRGRGQAARGAGRAWSSTPRNDHKQPRHRRPGGQDVPDRGLPRPLRGGAAGDRVPQRRGAERADDRRPDHRAHACSHHLCPIIGRVWIGVMPNEHSNLIGLSKYARLTDWGDEPAADPGRRRSPGWRTCSTSACSPTAWRS